MSAKKQHDEWIEVVDKQGTVYDTARREEVHRNPSLLHRAVHILVVNGNGDIFLQKRSATKDIQPGKWDTSVGGHLNVGESYERAAKREADEELGIHGLSLEKLYDYPWRSDRESELVRTFLCRYDGPFSMDVEELETGRFWTLEEIQANLGTGVFTPNFEEEFSRYLRWQSEKRTTR